MVLLILSVISVLLDEMKKLASHPSGLLGQLRLIEEV